MGFVCISEGESYAGGRTTAGTGSHVGQVPSELPYQVKRSSRLGTGAWRWWPRSHTKNLYNKSSNHACQTEPTQA